MTLSNFGGNVTFTPEERCSPADHDAVLAILERHRGRKVGAIGSLHSWSGAAAGTGVVVDVRRLDGVDLQSEAGGAVSAQVGAGCTVERLLDHLHRQGGYTLPVYAIVGKQTVAGAISTATHGSGRASLSHYVTALTVAAYDPQSGRPTIHEWRDGDARRAARCAVGCSGIVLSLRIQVERDYLIEEQTEWRDRLDDVLDREEEFPRQQFYLVPWSWKWFVQRRRPLGHDDAVPSKSARGQRLLRRVGADVMLNGAFRVLGRTPRWTSGLKWFNRRVLPLVAQPDMEVADYSRNLLMMRHDLYRHLEMELFVPAAHLHRAASFVEWTLRCCGGETARLPDEMDDADFGRDVRADIRALQGTYVHDYFITFRRVLGDDTLISMTSGDEADAWYAISLLTYQRDHAPFLRMATFLASAMAAAYRARPHWGKICPLTTDEIAALYPALPRFRAHCASVDPEQVFVNDFGRTALGFVPVPQPDRR